MPKSKKKSEAEWKAELDPEAFHVLREKGTEPPFTGEYWASKERGVFCCKACGTRLFASDEKYESGTGWPSFWAPVDPENVMTADDHSFAMQRTEVLCAACGGHLGHLFPDGPRPTGLRYCINSACLTLDRDMDPGAAREADQSEKGKGEGRG